MGKSCLALFPLLAIKMMSWTFADLKRRNTIGKNE